MGMKSAISSDKCAKTFKQGGIYGRLYLFFELESQPIYFEKYKVKISSYVIVMMFVNH